MCVHVCVCQCVPSVALEYVHVTLPAKFSVTFTWLSVPPALAGTGGSRKRRRYMVAGKKKRGPVVDRTGVERTAPVHVSQYTTQEHR